MACAAPSASGNRQRERRNHHVGIGAREKQSCQRGKRRSSPCRAAKGDKIRHLSSYRPSSCVGMSSPRIGDAHRPERAAERAAGEEIKMKGGRISRATGAAA